MPSIATNSRVDRDELLAFLRPRNRAILLTHRPSGDVQMSPVTFGTSAEGAVLV
nr:PPOX class F420-dependent oxidoreductase [Geodermatophilaceae bacterium]